MYLTLLVADLLCILGGFFMARAVYQMAWPATLLMMEAQLLLPVYTTIALYQSTYSIKALLEPRFAIKRALLALLVASALLIFVTFYAKSTAYFSRVTFTLGLLFSGAAMVAFRLALLWLVRLTWGPRVVNVLLINDGGPEVKLSNSLVIDAAEHGLLADTTDPHNLDRLGRYLQNMDRVVVSCSVARRPAWVFVLRAAGVRGEVVSGSLQKLAPLGMEVEGDCISLIVSTGPLGLRARAVKRAFDLAVAGTALFVLAPVLLLVALAIKLEDRGPIFFTQRRLGRGNRFFQMLKFRSMKVEGADADGNRSASRGDDRVTAVGRFLRRTSLDELPQLINVLIGDMSVVGPRPHALGSQAGDKLFWEVDGHYWNRHALRPGLTGLAQVRGFRGATDHENDLRGRLRADLEYISRWSPYRDVMILLRTLRVMVHQKAF